jgi:glycosyltransferase involved in cell wall biosynthesis
LFAGDGPERENLQRLVTEAGLSRNVHFVGVVTDIRYPLSVLNLHFTAAVGEVVGIAGIESALAGVPVLAFQASSDYKTRPEDWVWSSNEHQEIVAAAVTLLDDTCRRHELAQRQREYATRYHSVECMAAAYREIYEKSARSRPASAACSS